MPHEKITCLFCQTSNDKELDNCSNCGMALAENHPEGKARWSFFLKAFVFIALFCLVMVFYLPR